jgi:multidrug transporter EmrE-like cation transporter
MNKYLLIFGGIILSAFAQIFLKISAMNEIKDFRWLVFFVLSISFYGVAFFVYSLVLKHFPISMISPIMTVGTVVLVVSCGCIMGETLASGQIAGLILGVVSILLILT